jgi:hypothetical protein
MIKHKTNSPPNDQRRKEVERRTYTPISDALSQPNTLADNEFCAGLVRFNLLGLLARCMNRGRRADGVELA